MMIYIAYRNNLLFLALGLDGTATALLGVDDGVEIPGDDYWTRFCFGII